MRLRRLSIPEALFVFWPPIFDQCLKLCWREPISDLAFFESLAWADLLHAGSAWRFYMSGRLFYTLAVQWHTILIDLLEALNAWIHSALPGESLTSQVVSGGADKSGVSVNSSCSRLQA